ncbi:MULTISPECIES: hypothetical protein [unclassified Coleofasciculus]|uniref:hypothetical protein n=1 Tax=unclassified Coleofasciculus TaxID=2692782 RepID=UPI00187F10E1|nr:MULTISPECIES: hypothetical protein [unclassified Coleofasciculus]MBE9125905.1 hypothetical protein [Coleofasciculus sp. LEGE 07081]MBE9149095.1 hypothetical protein [Coleofasciculus sp. LEGE 07092]
MVKSLRNEATDLVADVERERRTGNPVVFPIPYSPPQLENIDDCQSIRIAYQLCCNKTGFGQWE